MNINIQPLQIMSIFLLPMLGEGHQEVVEEGATAISNQLPLKANTIYQNHLVFLFSLQSLQFPFRDTSSPYSVSSRMEI